MHMYAFLDWIRHLTRKQTVASNKTGGVQVYYAVLRVTSLTVETICPTL